MGNGRLKVKIGWCGNGVARRKTQKIRKTLTSQKRRSRNGGRWQETGVWGRDSGKWGEIWRTGGSWREDLEGWREGWRAVWRTDSPDLGKTRLPSQGPKEPASYIPGHIDTCFVHLSRSTVTNVTYRHDLENWTWTAKNWGQTALLPPGRPDLGKTGLSS